ncbi:MULTISPECIES: type II CAAX endopeptidase family protein [Tissierellales]|jgi:hypothetical protein|uniref:CPBP family intramembrane metalloprotease n=1 Tax=Acidilutibacter cellobiosedens TaxID=2507161 RepID=A0A410QBT2_9FIRM|nr:MULTISPECIES: type II CAAX endopeptidase family protein [Tissierellales]MBE6082156.1 CPBP family intramembrane metalloprotease [Tissierellaceae bacterium]QAT61324.1 CPBP family intramembrane metalloprotease [Acidilutibacter cellobiosedens]SCL95077.1 CAAX amino terminal protease self-immunity [Sporanaerobacter sp. PP17-6a]
MNANSKPRIYQVNVFYLLVAFLLIFAGSYVQKREIYSGLVITEFLLILLPTVLFLLIKKSNFKKVLRLNKLSLKQILFIPLIVIFSYPVGTFLNYIVVAILSRFGEINTAAVPLPDNIRQLIISFFIIALSPGICEEVMFRGVMMSSYERFGKAKAILISALLFGLFHFNIQNFLGPVFLGIIFGIIVNKTNSIYSSIIAHTTNNTIALLIGYFFSDGTKNIGEESLSALKGYNLVIPGVTLGIAALLMGLIALRFIRALPEENEDLYLGELFTNSRVRVIEWLPLIVVLIFFVIFNYKIVFF